MATASIEEEVVLGPESAGLLMKPEEFDGITQYDENYRYELIHGVVIVSPIPLPEETHPNELLGIQLFIYKRDHPRGKILDATLPQQYVRTSTGRRIADRLIWTGLDRLPDLHDDRPAVAVEFVSGGWRDRKRDYVDKRQENMAAGIGEYWIIDRFKRNMTVILNEPDGIRELVIEENEVFESRHLPGFQVPLSQLLDAANDWAEKD